jgi:hypothetical protein
MLHSSKHSTSYTPPSEPLQPKRLPQDFQLATNLVLDYHPHLTEEQIEPIRKRVIEHIDYLRVAFTDFLELRGKRILDIACGSRNYHDDTLKRYEPWMPRLLVHLGAHPFGVDLAPQSDERFGWRQADLLTPGALSFVETHSFDAYYVCAFPTRKAIKTMIATGPSWPTVRTEILSHLERSLKPGGTIIRTFTNKTEEYVEQVRQSLQPAPELKLPPHVRRHYEDCFFD